MDKSVSVKKKYLALSVVHMNDDIRIYRKYISSLLKDGDYEITFICQQNTHGIQIDENIEYIKIPHFESRVKRILYQFPLYLRLRNSSFDVIHFHDPELIILMLFLTFKKTFLIKTRLVFDLHENLFAQIKQKNYIPSIIRPIIAVTVRMFFHLLENKIHLFAAANDRIREEILDMCPQANVVTINNYTSDYTQSKSISLQKPYDTSKRKNGILFLGRVTKIRGVYDFGRIVAEHLKGFTFHIVGDFAADGSEAHMKNLDAENIILHGKKTHEDLNEILDECFCGVLPYLDVPNHRNCTPNKLFEYLKFGLPVMVNRLPNNNNFAIPTKLHKKFDINDTGNVIQIVNTSFEEWATLEKDTKFEFDLFNQHHTWDEEYKKFESLIF